MDETELRGVANTLVELFRTRSYLMSQCEDAEMEQEYFNSKSGFELVTQFIDSYGDFKLE